MKQLTEVQIGIITLCREAAEERDHRQFIRLMEYLIIELKAEPGMVMKAYAEISDLPQSDPEDNKTIWQPGWNEPHEVC
jgi:hypothetical protein